MVTGGPEASAIACGEPLPAELDSPAPSPLAGSTVTLRVPAAPAFAGIVRLAASGLALRHGFDHARADQLRTAVDRAIEAIGPLPRPAGAVGAAGPAGEHGPATGPGHLRLTFVLRAHSLDVELAAEGRALEEEAVTRVVRAVSPLVDGIRRTGGADVTFVKHRGP